MVPALPTARVRAAIEAEDWALATGVLGQHQQALAAALAKVDLANEPLAPWRQLLLAQRALEDELRDARDRTALALAKLGQDQRGARAWARELA